MNCLRVSHPTTLKIANANSEGARCLDETAGTTCENNNVYTGRQQIIIRAKRLLSVNVFVLVRKFPAPINAKPDTVSIATAPAIDINNRAGPVVVHKYFRADIAPSRSHRRRHPVS